jgi:hypothetical protein
MALMLFSLLMLAVAYMAWVNTPEHLVLHVTRQAQAYGLLLWQQALLQAPALALSLVLILSALACAAFLFHGARFAPTE